MVPTDGTGPLRFCLCGPGLCCGLGRAEEWKLLPSLVLQRAGGVTNCKRERGHGHSVSGAGSSACLSSNVWVVQPSPCALGLCPYTIYLCCCEHTLQSPRCLSQAGLGKHWWCCGEGSKNCCWWSHSTMQQSPCSVLWVLQLCSTGVTSARWSLLTPESIHKGQWGHSHLLLRSQLWGWWPHSPWLHLGTSLDLYQLPSFSDFSLKWWYIWENENCTFTTISMIIHLLLTVHTSWSLERCFFPVLVWIQYELVPISMSGFLYQALISQRVFCSRFPLYFTQLDLFSRRLD